MDLAAHLGAFGPQLDVLDLGRAVPVFEKEFHSTSNWKHALDTYLESYHLAALHRDESPSGRP
jgi:hypothetical protein